VVSSPHAPVGKHADVAVHSLWSAHARHASLVPHTGVPPVHAAAMLVVHCTHTPIVVSHTGAAPEQSLGLVHAVGVSIAPSPPPLGQFTVSFGWPLQYSLLLSLQPTANTTTQIHIKRIDIEPSSETL
jgi:hypothetical protein